MVAKFKEPLDVITDHQISPRAQLPQNILNLHSEDHIRTIYPIRHRILQICTRSSKPGIHLKLMESHDCLLDVKIMIMQKILQEKLQSLS